MAEGVDETTARELALLIAKSAKPKWLKNALSQELSDVALEEVSKAAFDESAHPRDKDGKFGEGNGSDGGMSHQDHYAVANRASEAANKAQAKGDKRTEASYRAIAADHNARGLAKEKQAIANFRAEKPGDHIRLETMKGEVARREARQKRRKRARAEDGLIDAALSADAEVHKAAFPKAFKDSAQKLLPAYWYDQVHAHARSSAGGQASGVSRRHASNPQAKTDALWDRRNALMKELEDIDGQLKASPDEAQKAVMPTAQEVHVDVPLGSDKKGSVYDSLRASPLVGADIKFRRSKGGKKPKATKPQELDDVAKSARFDEDVVLQHLTEAALTNPLQEEADKLTDAQRLVVGMDWEMMVGATDAADARVRASRNINQALGYYDNKLQRDDELRRIKGLDLDLGSGQVRERGYLGLDLYPYDYGTATHDVTLGLPFPDSSVRSIRLINSLQYMVDLDKDPQPLLMEAQRVLNYGGKLTYVGRGDLTAMADWTQLPGLVLVGHEDSTPIAINQEDSPADLHKQTFERVRVRVPRVYGADPTWLGIEEEGPQDIAFALDALGAGSDAERAMSNLIESLLEFGPSNAPDPYAMKSASKADQSDVLIGAGAPIRLPSDAPEAWKKIVYSVVTAPAELDFDGEYMDADAIEKMAHDAYRDRVPIKSEHVSDPIGAHIVESYIAPADFTITGAEGPQHIPKGAWVIAIQFTDDEEWQKVLTGEYRGVSVGGRALIEDR